jgi:hypothetical protein
VPWRLELPAHMAPPSWDDRKPQLTSAQQPHGVERAADLSMAGCMWSLLGFNVKNVTGDLQWRDVVLASFSQWHGTRRGANAVLLNATEDVKVRRQG